MAKTFNNIYKEAKQKVYTSPSTVLTLLAKQNSQVEFAPILAPNGGTDLTLTTKYTIQRRKRNTIKTVANANVGSTASALAVLDSFSKIDWDTEEIATGVLKSIGFKKTFNDDYDFSSNPMHSRDLEYIMGEIESQRHKDLIALLKTDAPKTGAALAAFTAGDTKVWDDLAGQVDTLSKVDDAFKDISALTDFVIITTNEVARELSKEMGTVFNQEAAIAQTGFKTGMQVNGTPVIIDARLTGRDAIVLHKEALAFRAAPIDKSINVDLGIAEFTGRVFYDVMASIDKSRMAQFAV